MKYLYTLFSLFTLSTLFTGSLTAQWDRQYPVEKMEDVLDIDVSTDGHGFAVGTNDLMLRLDFTSREWELLPEYGSNWRFESVDYMDNSGGNIVAAGSEVVLLSMNGGETWSPVGGGPLNVHTLKMYSPDHIIAVSDAGAFVWKNNDWTDLDVPNSASLKGAFILDSLHIWAYSFSTEPAIYYTSNGGDTWGTNLDIDDIDVVRFFNATFGIATDGRDIYHSKNGGVTWTLRGANGSPNNLTDIVFGPTANVLYAAAVNAEPTISVDSGKTWMEGDHRSSIQRSFSVATVSEDEIWIGSDMSSILKSSSNGSFSWAESHGPNRGVIQDIHFITRSLGFAGGLENLVLRTLDGGTNWEDISIEGNRTVLAIHGLNAQDVWIGSNQRILHSVDTGSTWTESLVLISSNFNDVFAISSQTVLAVNSSGIIYRTTNGGAKWDTVYNAGAATQLKSIARINDQQYMVTGFNGTILRSSDQGATWQLLTPPEAGLQYDQSYFLDTTGWLVTSSFKKTIWRTTNAGDTWTPMTLPVDRFWDGVYFITPDTGVVVGRSTNEGRAYITYNGGLSWSPSYTLPFPLFGVSGFPNPNGTAWIYGTGSDIEVLPNCNAFPEIANFMGELFPCEGDTITFSVSSENIDNFLWHFPGDWKIIGNTNNDTVNVLVGGDAGFISVNGFNPCGEAGQIIVNTSPSLLPSVFNIFGDLTPCPGDTVEYNVITLEVGGFQWSVPGGWQVLGNLTEPDITVVAGKNPGAISMTGSNTCGSEQLVVQATPHVIPDVQVSVTNLVLSLSEVAASYQWYFNGELIPGATNATYHVTENGLYHAEIVLFSGCVTTSDVIQIMNVATKNPSSIPLNLYPIPSNDKIFVDGISGVFDYSIIDLTGRLMKAGRAEEFINISELNTGCYLLKLDSGDSHYIGKLIRE